MRNQTFDAVKGVGIIAMIIGHTAIPLYMMVMIYSWHMPLFFLVAGYFYRQKDIKGYLKSNLRQLLIPYLITAFLFVLLRSVVLGYNFSAGLLSVFIGAGTGNLPILGNYFVGAIWSLLAMFWCRVIYNIIFVSIKKNYIRVGVILCGFLISNYLASKVYIPTNLLQGISAMLFFYIGHEASRFKLADQKYKYKMMLPLFISCALIFGIFLHVGRVLGMVNCYYPCWPIDILGAILITYSLYHLCKTLPEKCIKHLAFYGRISLLVLCVHDLEISILSRPLYLLNNKVLHINGTSWYMIFNLFHIVLSLLLSLLLYKKQLVKKVFSLI